MHCDVTSEREFLDLEYVANESLSTDMTSVGLSTNMRSVAGLPKDMNMVRPMGSTNSEWSR